MDGSAKFPVLTLRQVKGELKEQQGCYWATESPKRVDENLDPFDLTLGQLDQQIRALLKHLVGYRIRDSKVRIGL